MLQKHMHEGAQKKSSLEGPGRFVKQDGRPSQTGQKTETRQSMTPCLFLYVGAQAYVHYEKITYNIHNYICKKKGYLAVKARAIGF